MILKAPTGLYERLLPQGPTDSASVTFSISNNDPPPVPLIQTVVAPQSVVFAPDPPSTSNRDDYGDLVFSIVEGRSSTAGSNKKAFEAGEIINFTSDDFVSTSTAVNKLTIQHNTNVLDLSGLGLSADDIALISQKSDEAIELKRTEVAALQTDIIDLRIAIRENQKTINECTKAIKAVEVTFSGSSGADILEKLASKMSTLEAERTYLNGQLTSKSAELVVAQDELIDLSQVVR